MRIGLVTGEYPPMQGGVGAYSAILARMFAEHIHGVSVFTSPSAQEHDSRIRLMTAASRWSFSTLQTVKRWARAEALDVVNLQFQTAAFGMSPFIHFLPDVLHPIPVVTTFHDLRFPYLFPKAGKLRDWIVMRLARASAGVIVTNHEDYARLTALGQVTLIPIGSNIAVHVLPVVDVRQANAKNQFLIGYFGLINHSKGLETLLHSLKQLRDDGIDASLVLIGGTAGASDPTNQPYLREIDDLITALELTPFVQRTGYIDDAYVSAWLKAVDVVALPFRDGASFRRGSLMAAIQHECAIITTQPVVPIPEFRDGDTMLLHPIDDVRALVAACKRLHNDPVLRRTLSNHIASLKNRFNWSSITTETVQFFERITEATA